MSDVTPSVLVLPASLRKESFNRRLAGALHAELLRRGVSATLADVDLLRLPIYDGDEDTPDTFPVHARELHRQILAHRALLIVSPEYNFSIPGGLKNAIDWVSRAKPNAFDDRIVQLAGGTQGGFGTVRMQPHLRACLAGLGAEVMGVQITVSKVQEAFDASGALHAPAVLQTVDRALGRLVARLATP